MSEQILSVKMLDIQLPSATFIPNPHADFITIHDKEGGEVTLTGCDFWRYVGECCKRAQIDSQTEWLESQPANSFIPHHVFRDSRLDY